MTDALPPWYSDELCLHVAQRLQSDRAVNDPRFVEAGRITAKQATHRATCSAALVTVWRHLVDGTTFDIRGEFDVLGVTWSQLRRDIATTADATHRRAGQRPDDATAVTIAGAVAVMRAALGDGTGCPNRIFCHDATVRERATLARKAA